MSKTPPPVSKRPANWKAGLALFAILVVILAVIIPLALMNSDDRHQPAKADERRIAAVFFPQHDGDTAVKSDYAFLETCTFKHCELPVIVLDHTGETYRYLVNPHFPQSVAISPNGRVATFVGHDGILHTFFNGAMHTLGGMDHDFSGGITVVRDDGESVAIRTAPAYAKQDAHLYATKEGQLYQLPAAGMVGKSVACDGALWRFQSSKETTYGKAVVMDQWGYNWETQTFDPIERPNKTPVTYPVNPVCLDDGQGAFAFVQADPTTPGQMRLWTWTKANGFAPHPSPAVISAGEEAEGIMTLAVDATYATVVLHNGKVTRYALDEGTKTVGPDLTAAFAQTNGYIHARTAVAGDKLYVVGKDATDPERWLLARYDLGTGSQEILVVSPFLTENYLDRFIGDFQLRDPQALDAWITAQGNQ